MLSYHNGNENDLGSTFGDSRAVRRPNPNESYIAVALRGLRALCDAARFSPDVRAHMEVTLKDLILPWGRQAIGVGPAGQSDITDEHFPIEFSLALEGDEPEVRVLFEAQAPTFEPRALWQAGWELCEKLERDYGVSLARLRAVADLFEPSPNNPDCRFALWHAVSFSASGAVKFKVYVNPLARGKDQGPAVVRATLSRLGFTAALQDVFADCQGDCEFRFLSLDLSDSSDARVKIYRVHHDATRSEIESWLRVVPGYDQASNDQFWSTIAGPSSRFSGIPVSTYLSLDSRSARPSAGTIHFPVRSYASDDLEVQGRVRSFLTQNEYETYERALAAFATRPLDAGVGLHSYVSVRLHRGRRHVTFYLSPEAYEVAPPLHGAIKLAV